MSVNGLQDWEPVSLWASVWMLLRLRVVILISGFRRAKLRRKIGMIVLAVVLLGFLGFVFAMSWLLLRFLRSPELVQFTGDMAPILNSVPVLIVAGAFLGILITSFGVLLQALYLAGDMDFLLSAPISLRAVFIAKLLQAILPNFSLICLFALPVLFGLGASSGFSLLYYPLVIIMMAALALAAAGISSLFVMFIVRIFPARRVAEVLGFIGALLSFICSQSGNLAQFNQMSGEQAMQAVNLVSRFNQPWSPLAWAGRGLVGIGEGNWLEGGGFSLLALGVAVVIFAFALTTSERLYYNGWASMQGNFRKKKAHQARPTAPQSEAARSINSLAERNIPATIRAIILKDFYVLRRDLRNMSQLVTPLIFGIVYAVMFLRGGDNSFRELGNAPLVLREVLRNAAVYINVGISLFVGWLLLARLAGMGFSQEGRSYWLIRTAPVRPVQLLAAKFLVAFLPTLVLGWGFLLVISLLQRSTVANLVFTMPVVALVIAGNTGVNLTFGVVGANMNWDDPRHMQRGTAGCLGSLATMAYLPVSLVLFFGPPLIFTLVSWPQGLGQLVGLLLGGVVSLACAFVPLHFVRERVMKLGEEN